MKLLSTFGAALISITLALTSLHADAARMGGGKSMGKQSQNVTNRQATPPANAPANNAAAAPAKPATPAPAAPAPAAPRPWGAMLGGLAAGLGLAWLANSMGLGGALGGAVGNILTLLLMGFAAFMAWNMYKRYKASQQEAKLQPAYARGYSPSNVGNDAAARPFERTHFSDAPVAPTYTPTSGSMIGSAVDAPSTPAATTLTGAQSWGIPAGFDTIGFLAGAKAHFVNLQAAWDRADLTTLQTMLTEEMLTEIRGQLTERDAATPAGTVHRTEVISVDAQLLGIEELPADVHAAHYMASVEFSGVIREEIGLAPAPFKEVWNLTKPVAGGGWLVAGIQALS